MFRAIVREHKHGVHVYQTMGEPAKDRIHHALKCGAALLETEHIVMEHIATKNSDDRGLRYVSWVYMHLKVFNQVQLVEDMCITITIVSSVMFGIG